MNLAVANSPRFTCRMVRGWISILGDDTRALQSAHVAGCPDCQAFFSAGDELELALRREAAAVRVAPRDTLEQDILRAVRQSARPARRHFTLPVLSLCGVAAAIAAAIVMLQSSVIPPATQPATTDAPVADVQPLLKAMPQILQQDPLQNEVDSVVANARSAMHFLALNFLPADSAQALAPSRG